MLEGTYPSDVKYRLEQKTRMLDNGCIIFTGALNPKGYGQLRVGKTMQQAHRVAYVLKHGEIEGDLQVRHSCDNPSCVNVDHLILGTNQDNMDDRTIRFRSASRKGQLNPNVKILEEQAKEIRAAYRLGETQKSLARKYNISPTQVHRIIWHESWL